MAVPGQKPKEDRSQVRHRMPVAEWTEVENVPFEGAPALPTREHQVSSADAGVLVGLGVSYPESTVRWYETISTMPHAKLWTAGDWEFVFATAEVHARTMESWRGYTGPELRNREKLIGVFAEARRDLRIRYVEPKPAVDHAEADNVVSINSLREL